MFDLIGISLKGSPVTAPPLRYSIVVLGVDSGRQAVGAKMAAVVKPKDLR